MNRGGGVGPFRPVLLSPTRTTNRFGAPGHDLVGSRLCHPRVHRATSADAGAHGPKTRGTRMVGVVRRSRGGPSSRTRPSPRGRQHSGITLLAKAPEIGRNSAECTQSPGAVGAQARRPRVYPAPVGRRTLRRVARAAQHRGVGDVERRTASGERHDVVDRQVTRGVGGTQVARTPVAVLPTPCAEHAGAETLPGPRAVQGVVPVAVGRSCVVGAATTSAARQQAADGAELHALRLVAVRPLTLVTLDCMPVAIATSVMWRGAGVYSPAVLRLQAQQSRSVPVCSRNSVRHRLPRRQPRAQRRPPSDRDHRGPPRRAREDVVLFCESE